MRGTAETSTWRPRWSASPCRALWRDRLEDAERVRAAVRELPVPQQRAVVLAAFFGRTAEEISSMEQIPLGTAKTRIRTAMLRLRSTLAEEARR